MATLKSLFFSIYAALNNVYSGWILWNLFLAFLPLLMSVVLFRRQTLTKWKLFGACFGLGFIGIVGTQLRTPWVIDLVLNKVDRAIATNPAMLLNALWFGAIIVFTLTLNFWLFRKEKTLKSGLWWIGFVCFICFLPNAPYVLTDIIHLIRGTSSGLIPTWVVALVFIPLHVTAIAVAFEAYVLSILNLNDYLRERAGKLWILPTELTIHLLSAIGIYLGRFLRFNSWDVVVDPTSVVASTLNTLTSKRPLAVIGVTFLILAVLYWVMKQITLGLRLRFYLAKQGIDIFDLPNKLQTISAAESASETHLE
ncbi:protein of unknown function DUF1361 [[Leptolyngbya] sp. PCC 7376]|uniref:DUF1361 domain-containing protein n=1 Tax=[Leptolyngbya] sp. PCC 7376 TaxID=111781 RepID=UPI00029EDBDD|nr:DUF1361 domain-containing protein [[Leptolyngbya] sp. PCC 7376]AFY37727.1 protein of unknown function DUF1361 [[Leptolyngbya] sp. PCC 7376]